MKFKNSSAGRDWFFSGDNKIAVLFDEKNVEVMKLMTI